MALAPSILPFTTSLLDHACTLVALSVGLLLIEPAKGDFEIDGAAIEPSLAEHSFIATQMQVLAVALSE